MEEKDKIGTARRIITERPEQRQNLVEEEEKNAADESTSRLRDHPEFSDNILNFSPDVISERNPREPVKLQAASNALNVTNVTS